jgi:hypothetical protein
MTKIIVAERENGKKEEIDVSSGSGQFIISNDNFVKLKALREWLAAMPTDIDIGDYLSEEMWGYEHGLVDRVEFENHCLCLFEFKEGRVFMLVELDNHKDIFDDRYIAIEVIPSDVG